MLLGFTDQLLTSHEASSLGLQGSPPTQKQAQLTNGPSRVLWGNAPDIQMYTATRRCTTAMSRCFADPAMLVEHSLADKAYE